MKICRICKTICKFMHWGWPDFLRKIKICPSLPPKSGGTYARVRGESAS